MSPPLTEAGSVTLAIAVPDKVIGTVANTYVVTCSMPPEPLRYGIRSATVLPNCTPSPPAARVQSPKPTCAVWVVPSA
jgi:hypothetical protein